MSQTVTEESTLSKVPISLREAAREFAALAQQVCGERMVGLALYGHGLGKHFDGKKSHAASVLVMDRADLDVLRRMGDQGARLGKMGLAAPMVMTSEFVAGALDSFPLELLEISQRRVTIAGRDCFENLAIEAQHVRLQCEREFRRIQIRMRQGLLATGERDDRLSEMVADIGRHLLRTLRGLLWLKGFRDHVPRKDVVRHCEELVGRPMAGARAALENHGRHDWAAYQALYDDVEAFVTMSDAS